MFLPQGAGSRAGSRTGSRAGSMDHGDASEQLGRMGWDAWRIIPVDVGSLASPEITNHLGQQRRRTSPLRGFVPKHS